MSLRVFKSTCDKIDLHFISEAGNMWRLVMALKGGKEAEQMLRSDVVGEVPLLHLRKTLLWRIQTEKTSHQW